jgi:hypothetical protein
VKFCRRSAAPDKGEDRMGARVLRRKAARLSPSRVTLHCVRRRGQRSVAIAVVLGAAIGAAVPAVGHYSGFTGSVYQDRDVPPFGDRCILSSGVCSTHSWTFISAGESSSATSSICAVLWKSAGNHNVNYEQSCAPNFVRHCNNPYNHSANQLDCHDQDTWTGRHVGATNLSTTTALLIEMHGGY